MTKALLAPCAFTGQTEAGARVLAHTWIQKFVLEAQRPAIALCGAVGAGKTTFVKHCLRALGVIKQESDFSSPSFNIMLEYPPCPSRVQQGMAMKTKNNVDTCSVHHIDLYKINNIKEIEDMGLFESTGKAIFFIEWPERIGWAIPTPYYCIHIKIANEHTRDYLFSFVQETSTYHGT